MTVEERQVTQLSKFMESQCCLIPRGLVDEKLILVDPGLLVGFPLEVWSRRGNAPVLLQRQHCR